MAIKKALLILISPKSPENSKEALVTDSCKYFGKTLQTKGIEVDLIDLYQDVEDGEFEPVYYPGKDSVKTIEYQVRVQNADLIIIFFPI